MEYNEILYGRPKPMTPKAGVTKAPSRRYSCGGRIKIKKK